MSSDPALKIFIFVTWVFRVIIMLLTWAIIFEIILILLFGKGLTYE